MAWPKHFIDEHPWSARIWKIDDFKDLMGDLRVSVAYANMCQSGMATHIGERKTARLDQSPSRPDS